MATTSEVGAVFDVPYNPDPSAQLFKQRLDVYYPLPLSRDPPTNEPVPPPPPSPPTALRGVRYALPPVWAGCCCGRGVRPGAAPAPPASARLPVTVVVHGGGWKRFDRRTPCGGLHGNMGVALAARGHVAVVIS